MMRNAVSTMRLCWRAAIVVSVLLASDLLTFELAQSQPRQSPFIMLIFVADAAEAWTMHADPTGDVAACRQTTNPQGEKHNDCRHGTQSQASYAKLQSLTSDARAVPATKASPDPNRSEFQIIISQYGGMSYDGSAVAANPVLKQLADLMVETNRRVGGDDFVPRFRLSAK